MKRASDRNEPRRVHPYAWAWEPLESEPTFVLRAMFGAKAVYLHGRLSLCFCAGDEPWHGVLVCTDHTNHEALRREFPRLVPHPVLPKWLYLSDASPDFESATERLIRCVKGRDPRIGVEPKPRKRARTRARGSRKSR